MAKGLGTLTVWLNADTGKFKRGMTTAKKSMATFKATAVAAAAASSAAITAFATMSVRAFMFQEEATNRLTIALRNTGDAAAASLPGLQRYAQEIQRMTVYGDEVVESVMAQGINLGINTKQIKEATTAAAGLAAKYGIDLSSAMMLVGRASQGQTQMLTRYGIVLDENATKEEKFAQLLKIGADNFALAEGQTETLEGGLKQLSNAWGDLQEEVGKSIVQSSGLQHSLKSVVETVNEWNASIAGIDAPTKTFIVRLTAAAIAAGSLGLAIKLLKIPTVVRGGWLTMTKAVTVAGGALSKMTAIILANAASLQVGQAGYAGLTSQMLRMKAATFATQSAMHGLGAAGAAVGVAIAGWQIGKKAAELMGLEEKFGRWFFGTDGLERESAELDKKLEELKKKRAEMGKEEPEKQRETSDAEKKLIEEIAEIKHKAMMDAMSLEDKLAEKIKERDNLQSQIWRDNMEGQDEQQSVKMLELMKQEAAAAAEIAKMETNIQEKAERERQSNSEKRLSAVQSAQEAINKVLFDRLDAEKQMEVLEKRRLQLAAKINAEQDITKRAEMLQDYAGLVSDIGSRSKEGGQAKAAEKATSPLVSAIQKGSMEAMRAEQGRTKTEDKIEANTRKTASGIDKMAEGMSKILGKVGIAGGLNLEAAI